MTETHSPKQVEPRPTADQIARQFLDEQFMPDAGYVLILDDDGAGVTVYPRHFSGDGRAIPEEPVHLEPWLTTRLADRNGEDDGMATSVADKITSHLRKIREAHNSIDN